MQTLSQDALVDEEFGIFVAKLIPYNFLWTVSFQGPESLVVAIYQSDIREKGNSFSRAGETNFKVGGGASLKLFPYLGLFLCSQYKL